MISFSAGTNDGVNIYANVFTETETVHLSLLDASQNTLEAGPVVGPNSDISHLYEGYPDGTYYVRAEPQDGSEVLLSQAIVKEAPPVEYLTAVFASCFVNPEFANAGIINYTPHLSTLPNANYYICFWNEDTNSLGAYDYLSKQELEQNKQHSTLPDGNYTVFVSTTSTKLGAVSPFYPVEVSCSSEPAVLGCTDPEALNYNADATQDNNTCKYLQTIKAVGGVLSNPIEYTLTFDPNDGAAVAKTNHHVVVNIYKEDEATPFATTKARIRNGQAVVDVAVYVKALLKTSPPESSATIDIDPDAMVKYRIGYIEKYGNTIEEEKFKRHQYAVNAALQTLNGSFTAYVIQP